MPQPLTHLVIALVTALTIAAPRARASAACDAATMVAVVHDRYHAVLNENDPIRSRSAAQLFAMLPDLNAAALAVQMTTDQTSADPDRMTRVFSAAYHLSQDLITGAEPAMVSLAPHLSNVKWLAENIAATNCFQTFSADDDGDTDAKAGKGASSPKKSSDKKGLQINIGLLLALLGGVALVGLVMFIRKSKTYKIMQAQRLPRHLTTISVQVDFETPMRGPQSINVNGLDISAGGMKLAWEDAAPRETALTIKLPIGERTGSVVWSNAYYAGIVFDQRLDADELKLMIG